MKKERILSYDVFRGFLLIGMVIFHILVNFTDIKFDQNYFYWVPLGFMLFLGVILGKFLDGKNKKTIILGIKLAVIFLVLNIPNFISKNFTLSQFLIGDQKIFSFEILLPMSITTFMSIGLNRFVKNRIIVLITLLAFLSILTWLYLINIYSYNLSFLIYGIIGYLIGKNLDLDGLSKKPSNGILIVIFLASIAPFFIINSTGIIEVFIILQVLAFYLLLARMFNKNKFLSLLGKHSLFLYVFHVMLIKAATSLLA